MKKNKKSSEKKHPNKRKHDHDRSSYICFSCFCADHCAGVKADWGDVNAEEVTAELGRLWNELKDSNKVGDHSVVTLMTEGETYFLGEIAAYFHPSNVH